MSGTNPRRSPQFCPGLAAFTDAIEALPQETIRHFTLLREVDAKASGPEDILRSFIKRTLNPPLSNVPLETETETDPIRHLDDRNHGSHNEGLPGRDESPSELPDDHTKRSRLHQVRVLISDLLLTLDEKIHVISTASEALAKHQVRIDDAYDATTHEIDPVIRDGNPGHWAYGNSILESSFNQRPAANDYIPATVYPVEPEPSIGVSRAESRRDGASRRYAHAPDSSDSKATSHTEATASLYENSPIVPAAKRRKGTSNSSQVNKAMAPERSVTQARSGAFSNPHIVQTAKTQTVGKVHGPQNSVNNPKQPSSRKRAPGHPVVAALSPTKQGFVDTRATGGLAQSSETPIILNPDGGKKDTGHRNPRSKPHSAKPEGLKTASKTDNHAKHEDKIPLLESKLTATTKVSQDFLPPVGNERTIDSDKEAVRKDDSVLSQENPTTSKNDSINDYQHSPLGSASPGSVERFSRVMEAPEKVGGRGAIASSGKPAPKPSLISDTMKNLHSNPPKAGPNKPSKAANGPPTHHDSKPVPHNAREDYEDDDDEGDIDADEMRYCYCNQVSYGKMVACDGPGCQREWFHLPCVGLSHMPSSKDKWYCRECRASIQNPVKSSKIGQHRV